MAIVVEQFELYGRSFTRTYSNSNRYVVREGIDYEIADDPAELGRKYREGEEMPPLPPDPSEEATSSDYESALSELGVSV